MHDGTIPVNPNFSDRAIQADLSSRLLPFQPHNHPQYVCFGTGKVCEKYVQFSILSSFYDTDEARDINAYPTVLTAFPPVRIGTPRNPLISMDITSICNNPTTWVIVGASRGIGLEWVRQLLARGDHVLATVRDPAKASQLWGYAGIAESGSCRILECDVTKEPSIDVWGFHIGFSQKET